MTTNSITGRTSNIVKPGRNQCYICSKDIMLPVDISKPHYHICTSCGRSFCTRCGIQFLCVKCTEHLPDTEQKNVFGKYRNFQQTFGGGLAMTIIGPICIAAGIAGIVSNAKYGSIIWVIIGIAAIGIGVPLLIFGIRNLVIVQPAFIKFLQNEFTKFPIDATSVNTSTSSPAPGTSVNPAAPDFQTEKPKFCSKCGKPVKASAAFCEHCGEKL